MSSTTRRSRRSLDQLREWVRSQNSTEVFEDAGPDDREQWKGSIPDFLRFVEEQAPAFVTLDVGTFDEHWLAVHARMVLARETDVDEFELSLDDPRAEPIKRGLVDWVEAHGHRMGEPINVTMTFYDEDGDRHLLDLSTRWMIDFVDEVDRRSGIDPGTGEPIE